MTVEELFMCFIMHFDKIVYYDETLNIQDSICVKKDNGDYSDDEYNNFLNEYGEYEVKCWKYNFSNNTIDIEV